MLTKTPATNTGFALVGGQCASINICAINKHSAGRQLSVPKAHQRKARKRCAICHKNTVSKVIDET